MAHPSDRRCRIARIIDPKAWADMDKARQAFPADPFERFLEEYRIELSLQKADEIEALQ